MPTPVAPAALTAAGLSPDRADRATFVARSIARDDFIKNTQIPELQASITNVYNNSLEAFNSGVSASANAASSATNASQAAAASAATQWVSGTSYVVGDARWSPITKISYRRLIAGAGTTDPSADTTNWGTIVLPIAAGGTGAITVSAARTALDIKQLQSIDHTLAANALTLKLNPTNLDFRSTTLTSGAPVNVSNAAQLTTTLSSGSTAGTVSAVQSDIILLAINNVGTMELAWTNLAGGLNLDESNLINTVAEGGAGAADSNNVIYSTTARTGVAYRVVGLFRSTQTVAGTWAQTPTLVQAVGGLALATAASKVFHVRDEKPTATSGGSSVVGDQVRTLNTVVINTISGASLAANQITLPAGTYKVTASAPASKSDRHRIRLLNITDATVALVGSSQLTAAADDVVTSSRIVGVLTITATKVFNLTHYIQTARVTLGLGVESNDTAVSIYAEIFIEKLG